MTARAPWPTPVALPSAWTASPWRSFRIMVWTSRAGRIPCARRWLSNPLPCRSMSKASGCMLLSVDYRLAPEYPFPAAIADGCHATEWVVSHTEELGIDPARIGVCGDSAGATLAAVVCQAVAAGGRGRLALQ